MCEVKTIKTEDIPNLVKTLKEGDILVIEFGDVEEKDEKSKDGKG